MPGLTTTHIATAVLSWFVAASQCPSTSSSSTSRSGKNAAATAKLTCACQRQAEAAAANFGADHVHLAPPFIVAGDLPLAHLARWNRNVVRHAAEAMWRDYFVKRPTDPITILLFGSKESYLAFAKIDYPSDKATCRGDDDVPYYGYYRPDNRTLVMNIATGGGTLIHELTHALIVYDFPRVPDWFNEGLGSLHEQCDRQAWSKGRLVGNVNWRLPDLQSAIEAGKLRPLRELITTGDFRDNRETLNYAQARYFCMFLQKRGVLRGFYKAFRDGYGNDHTGLSYVEDVMGRRRIELIEQEFVTWVRQLSYP